MKSPGTYDRAFRAAPWGLLPAAAVLLLIFANAVWGLNLDQLSINGFTSIEIEKQLDEHGEGDPNYSFDADLFDLLLNFQIGEKMRATVDLAWEHGAETGSGFGSTDLEYAFIEHTVFDEMKFRIGKILTPFGIFNEIHRAKPAYYAVNVPLSTSIPLGFSPTGYLFFPRAGVGLSLQGETTFDYSKTFEYNLFIANGIQDSLTNPFEKDGNKSKSITARVRYDVTRQLRAGKSFYVDNLADGSGSLLFSDGYEVELNMGNLQVVSELVIGNRFGYRTDSGKTDLQQRGFFVQPSYSFDPGLTPYTRFEYLDPNIDVESDYSMLFAVGIHYEISRWYSCKFETDYYHFGSRSRVPSVPGAGYTEVKGSLVLGF